MYDNQLTLIFGECALAELQDRQIINAEIDKLTKQNEVLLQQAQNAFNASLSGQDIIVAAATGVLCGAVSGCFKSFVPQHGKLKHKHGTQRTAVDYQVPKPAGVSGSVQGYHRQIGPGHDLARFKEALDLISGNKSDFPLWGKNISELTGEVLHSGNLKVDKFISTGGFKIPVDPKAELMNHLLIDFFTKTSLPIPFSSYLADHNEFLAKIMIGMYKDGLNLKNLVGSTSAVLIIQLVTHSYSFLFHALPKVNFFERIKSVDEPYDLHLLIAELMQAHKDFLHSQEFRALQMIAHGSSFLVDSCITMTSKNYTGILALDYASLFVLASNSVKYITTGVSNYQQTLQAMEQVNLAIDTANHQWFTSFRQSVLLLAASDNFNETFNPRFITQQHNNVMLSFENHARRKHELSMELQELYKDEDI